MSVLVWTELVVCASESDPSQIAARATQEIQAGRFETAVTHLEQAVREYPKSVDLWNLLGIAQTELHRPAAARSAFEHGLQLAPDSVSLNENIGFLFFREPDYSQAKKYLARAVALGSEQPGVRFSLAASKLRTGEDAAALSELRSLENSLSNVAAYWEERGRAELGGDSIAADESFERALAIEPNSLVALNGAAAAAEKQGQDEKALAILLRARKASPNDVETLTHFGAVCIRRDLGLDAVDALETAHRLQPADNQALYLLARANISLQNWQHAHELFQQFTERVPNFGPAYYALGWLDIKLNRTDEARQELQRCLSLAPNLLDAAYELGQLDLDEGRLDAADQLLRKVLDQNPRHAKANMAFGDLMLRRGQIEKAQQFLEIAIQEDPKLAPAHYKLSMLLFRTHQSDQAEKERALAAALNKGATQAAKTQLKLAMPESSNAQ